MAQAMFQVSGLWHDPEYADVQGFQQTAVLRGVSRNVIYALVLEYSCLHDRVLLVSLTKFACHFIAERKLTRENCCQRVELFVAFSFFFCRIIISFTQPS